MAVAAREHPEAVVNVDALFVINQDTPAELVALTCRARGYQSIAVATTHAPLGAERDELLTATRSVRIVSLAELLDDSDAVTCDEQATRECTARIDDPAVRMGYSRLFMSRSLELKNERIREALLHRFRPGAVHFAPGLGVHAGVWQTHGGEPLTVVPATGPSGRVAGRTSRMIDRVRSGLRAMPPLSLVRAPQVGQAFVFIGSPRRLAFAPDCIVEPIDERWLTSFWPTAARIPRLYHAALGQAVQRRTRDTWTLCTTIHEYRPAASIVADAIGRELLIFVDGYHPSNYPRSYLDMYLSGTFVSASVISKRWFERHGRHVRPPFLFQRSERFAECTPRKVRTVVLLMNHAGDWTALINRSDSDVLIDAYVDLARHNPQRHFILRLHPTMAHAEHEGSHSVERIRRFVADQALPNLVLSDQTLDQDLSRGQLFLSEYSQVLIDVWRTGRLGLAVNLTHRRSFMADYEQIGFGGIAGAAQLEALFAKLDEGVGALVAQQNEARFVLNRLQEVWENSASERNA